MHDSPHNTHTAATSTACSELPACERDDAADAKHATSSYYPTAHAFNPTYADSAAGCPAGMHFSARVHACMYAFFPKIVTRVRVYVTDIYVTQLL
jgi:hypothetical protein